MDKLDRDHVFWTEPHWTSSKTANRLRSTPSLIINTPRPIHELRHAETPPVPLLGHHAIVSVLKRYYPGSTPIKSVDNLLNAIEASAEHPRVHEIERNLADLAVWAIELGKPYWRESPDEPKATIIDLAEYRR